MSDVLRVGLLADPDLPADIATQMSTELPALLAEHVSDQVAWEVEVVSDRFVDEPDPRWLIPVGRARMAEEGWDLAVCLTDLPRRAGLRPVVADASVADGVAWTSLPSFGARRMYRRARDMVVRLVEELAAERLGPGRQPSHGVQGPLAQLVAPIRRVDPADDDDVDVRFVLPGVRGPLRLLAGMVRANRPWRLVAGLSGTLAAALAAGAFAVVTSDIWTLADSLSPLRLAVATVCSMAAMIAWLIVDHEVWERPSGRVAREQARLFNAATVLTVALGVATLYAALFAVTLLAEWFVVTGDVLRRGLGHPVDAGDYVTIAWLASSIATVGGALGSGLESDGAVRAAAYGYRQKARHEQPAPEQGGSPH